MHKHPQSIREAGNENPSEYLDISFADGPATAEFEPGTSCPPDPMGPVVNTMAVMYDALVEILAELGPDDPIDAAVAPTRNLVVAVQSVIAYEIASQHDGAYTTTLPAPRFPSSGSWPQYVQSAVAAFNELLDYVNANVGPGIQPNVPTEIALLKAVQDQITAALKAWPSS